MTPTSTEIYTHQDGKNIDGDFNVKLDFNEKEYKCDEALDIIGFGKVQMLVALTCGLMLMAVICETMGMMVIVIAAQCDLNLENYQKGFLRGVAFFGILISSYMWGYLSDTYGRKKVLFYSGIATVFFSCLSILANNFWIFLLLRLLSGISISAPSATLYAYLGEFNNVRNIGATISCVSTFVGLGNMFIAGIAWIILPQTWAFYIYGGLYFRPWQLVLLSYSLPGLLTAIFLQKLPESPKLLLAQNKEREAFKIIEWIYVKNTGKSADTFAVRKLQIEGNNQYIKNLSEEKGCWDIVESVWNQTVPLFRKPHLCTILICCVTQFAVFFTSAGMGLWFPEIENRVNSLEEGESLTVCKVIDFTKNISNAETSQICDDTVNTNVFKDSMSLGVFYIIGYLSVMVLMKPVGRSIILPFILLSSGLCGLSLIWITHRIAITLFFIGFLMLSGLCISTVNGALVDLIPTHLRAMAISIQLSFGRLGTIAGSNLVGWLLYKDCSFTFSLFAGSVIFCSALILFLPKRAP